MTYKEIKEKRDNLRNEIDALQREAFEADYEKGIRINELVKKKKAQYTFYCGLLKNYEKFKEGTK